MIKKKRTYKCCICGGTFTGYGNNPVPVKATGRCCDECNKLVVAERIRNLRRPGSPDKGQ